MHARPVDLGLERVREVYLRMALTPPMGRVVTVAGTNGKGSTISLIHDCLVSAGCNPGLYTSPHLVRYNERIRIDNQPVTDQALLRAFAAVEAARQDVTLTYFEFGTLAAMACFADANCDTWLLEVGLGGRLDAVNIVDADVALITTIDLDHQAWLGNTIEEIAAEKAGIMRSGRLAIYGDTPVPNAIRARAADIRADLRLAGVDYSYAVDKEGGWSWTGKGRQVSGLRAPAHWTATQLGNAALALAAIAELSAADSHVSGQRRTVSVPLTAGFLNPVLLAPGPWGRFQQVQRSHHWILDVAHNPQAAAVLHTQLATLPTRPGRLIADTVVVALLADKNISGFVAALHIPGCLWVICGVDDPRASTEAQLRTALHEAGIENVSWAPTADLALELARRDTPPGGRIVVTGSFRLVAPALEWLGLY
ncbi:MAG: Mur ligase family protein [Gammaproteobacteria bacterium]